MTNSDLFESNMYKEVIKQYDEVTEFINLDSNIKERLKLPQRALTVTFPFRRDEYDEVETVVGYRVQHVLSMGPTKGGIRYASNVNLIPSSRFIFACQPPKSLPQAMQNEAYMATPCNPRSSRRKLLGIAILDNQNGDAYD